MSTPIEVVGAFLKERSTYHALLSDSGKEVNTALESVLEDARRFKAIEKVHNCPKAGGYKICDHDIATDEWYVRSEPLAELATAKRWAQAFILTVPIPPLDAVIKKAK